MTYIPIVLTPAPTYFLNPPSLSLHQHLLRVIRSRVFPVKNFAENARVERSLRSSPELRVGHARLNNVCRSHRGAQGLGHFSLAVSPLRHRPLHGYHYLNVTHLLDGMSEKGNVQGGGECPMPEGPVLHNNDDRPEVEVVHHSLQPSSMMP